MKKEIRIALLWGIIAIGLLYHTIVSLMPLFWGGDIRLEGTTPDDATSMMVFSMIYCFFVPVIAILLISYCHGKWVRITEGILAIIYCIGNLFHMSDLIKTFSWEQLFVLPLILFVSILLLIETWKKEKAKQEV